MSDVGYLTTKLREAGGITCLSAAEAIDRLEARNAELEAALRVTANVCAAAKQDRWVVELGDMARAAIGTRGQ